MAVKDLESFYEEWSSKSAESIDFDIEASVRKADAILSLFPREALAPLRSILDFGCGYGAVLKRFSETLPTTLEKAVGVDFSEAAIAIAQQRCQQNSLQYHRLPNLAIAENLEFLRKVIPEKVDGVLLIDLLEHVPDCKQLISELASFTRFFIIKLPVESSIIDNYVLPKEYPSSKHSNGHLREFNANSVHYFIRQLGLTPQYESLYIYHPDDAFPPMDASATKKQRFSRLIIRGFKIFASKVLPKKIFLRCVGGGGYICIATFDSNHLLTP